jgi:hypothetical protein
MNKRLHSSNVNEPLFHDTTKSGERNMMELLGSAKAVVGVFATNNAPGNGAKVPP